MTVAVIGTDEELTIEIADDGRGYRGGATVLGEVGVGDGLRALVDRVNALGGSYEVNGDDGRGTTVWVKLPLTDLGCT